MRQSRRRPPPLLAGVLGGLLAAVAFPAPALAHGLVGRADLPVPPWLFAWAACCVLVLSFAGLAMLWPQPRLERSHQQWLPTLPAWLDPIAGAIGIAVFALVVVSGLAGAQEPLANLAPTFVWVIFWVGLAFVSLLLGDVFHALNPWRAIARAARWAGERVGVRHTPARYPERLGYWPAAAGLAFFAWCELGFTGRDDPSTLAWLILAYAAAQLAAMWRFGIDGWSARGDALGVYFGLLARLAPLHVRDRNLVARWPLTGATRVDLAPGLVALLTVMLGSTTFDGFSNGGIWGQLAGPAVNGLSGAGIGLSLANELVAAAGLLLCIGFIAAIYAFGITGMRSSDGGRRRARLPERFAHSLLPIAAAYVVAHYFSLLVYQGQAIAALASDPLGNGVNLFGTGNWTIDYNVISAKGIWYVQVAALVAGHVAGLVLAHDRALALWPRARAAVQSQYWMLTVMVGYTSLGLWLLSAVGT